MEKNTSLSDEMLHSNISELEKNEFCGLNYKVSSRDDEPIQDSHEEEPDETKEIKLYDYEKSLEENFEDGVGVKYMLVEVTKNGSILFSDTIPTPQSKVVVDFNEFNRYGSLEVLILDYDSIFGTRFTSFMKYNSNFFVCDERVMFEALLIKSKAFGFKPFYWSKNVIFKETGIKKDRATKILKRFEELGIITSKLVKSVISNRPMQITYYDLDGGNIIDLLPKIFENRENESEMQKEIKKYLSPINPSRCITTIMQ